MPTYLHPGVYIEEIPSGVRPIEGVGTSTAVFIGYTTKGPIGSPEFLAGFDDYVDTFGGIRDIGSDAIGDPMGFSVQRFFQNGGTKAYVVRLAKSSPGSQSSPPVPLTKAVGKLNHPDASNTTDGLAITAVNEGTWADGLLVKIQAKSDPTLLTVDVGRENARCEFVAEESYDNVSLDAIHPRFVGSVINDVSPTVDLEVKPLDSIPNPVGYLLGTSTSDDLSGANLDFTKKTDTERGLSLAFDGLPAISITVPAADFTGNLASLATVIQAEVRKANVQRFTADARCGTVVLTSGTRTAASATVVTGANLATDLKLGGNESTGAETLAARLASDRAELVDGEDGEEADASAFDAVFAALEKVRDITIVCLPGNAWDDSGRPAIEKAISHAEKMKSRMVIVDPPAGTELETEASVVALGLPTSTYSVLYYPWVKVANPFYDEVDNPGVNAQLLVQPSGYAAGMWSKIDARRGVWKAPAGLETALLGVAGVEHIVEDAEQDALNPLGANALRSAPGFANKVIWGSRTLSTRADPEWRYVPVRRTAIFLEQSIYGGIQWAVFEPNDHRLWASLRLNIESFMSGLFRAGAFQGEKATDAFFVRCGLGDTMKQGDIDRGQVIVIVGFAPLKPAEFVIVRIQQMVGQE